MLGGLILIICGLLIAIYPPLLSIIVAALLVFTGLLSVLVALQNRKMQKEYGNPIIRIFFQM